MRDREDESGEGDAAQAFATLRAEVTVMRQAVEALPKAMAANRPVDTSETLGAILKTLGAVGTRLAAIEKHPALALTPQQHANAIVKSGEGILRSAEQALDRAAAEAAADRRMLSAMIGSMRGQWKQLEWLAWTGLAAFLVGLVMSPMFAQFLPVSWKSSIAALMMHTDRWQAGRLLMETANPEAWSDLESAATLLTPNKAALAACRDVAAKTKKEQRCTIVMPAAP